MLSWVELYLETNVWSAYQYNYSLVDNSLHLSLEYSSLKKLIVDPRLLVQNDCNEWKLISIKEDFSLCMCK